MIKTGRWNVTADQKAKISVMVRNRIVVRILQKFLYRVANTGFQEKGLPQKIGMSS
jgi:hypothetical protein